MSLLKAIVMGGVDGVITSFAVAAGASFTDTPRRSAAIVGFSSLVADGFSMGVSEFLSSTSEHSVTQRRGAPAALGAACFVAFVAMGAVPISVFVGTTSLTSAGMFGLVELMLLGMAQSVHVAEDVLRGLLRTSCLGALAGGAAFGVAALTASV